MNGQKIKTRISAYLFFTGFLGNTLLVFAFLYIMHVEGLTSRQLLKKAIEKTGLSPPEVVNKILQPSVKYTDISLDGRVIETHPRILLPQLAGWDGLAVSQFIQNRIIEHKKDQAYLNYCSSDSLLSSVVCWLATNDEQLLQRIIRKMLGYELNTPTADTNYSNGWQLALAYDLVFPALTERQKQIIEQKIKMALLASLANLDEGFSSLWHGRSTHAAIAWLCAVVLSDRVAHSEDLQRRAQKHFLTAIDGLRYTAVWPGGYNYWIQARAFLFALASSAYVNGLNHARYAENVKQAMKQVGYWTIYATRPDNKIEGQGDGGSRVDLKDETRRVIDLIVQMTGDPVLAGYSKYLAKLHGVESYYRGYRWGFLLFNDPTIWAVGDGTMESVGEYLPVARLFGAKSTNYAYFRSGWGREDTFISVKAGHTFSHHGHYDAGHFTVFKDMPLAINSSTYNGFFESHRLNYAIRTIAKNSLIIQKPDEVVKPNRFFKSNVADGGQRLTMPTGSAVLSVENWFSNYKQGKHYEAAELINFASNKKKYAYISVDITSAYNNEHFDVNHDGGKVSQVVRQFLYLPDEDKLIVYDRITSTHKEYVKKWLLHTINQPKIKGLSLLKGKINDGIFESKSNTAYIQNGKGRMRLDVLYPEHVMMRLVGGNDYQYYVEVDGEDTRLDGVNFNQGASTQPWFDIGQWRIEIQPARLRKKDKFLVVMSLSLGFDDQSQVNKLHFMQKDVVGLSSKKTVVIFAPAYGQRKLKLRLIEAKTDLIVAGLSLFKKVEVIQSGKKIGVIEAVNGIAYRSFDDPLEGKIEIRW